MQKLAVLRHVSVESRDLHWGGLYDPIPTRRFEHMIGGGALVPVLYHPLYPCDAT